MKPILYPSNETAFDTNGIGILADSLECHVLPVLNGSYELTLRYPASGVHYKELVRRAIILAKPDPVSEPQPFRIYRRVPSSNGTITVYARHIAYDLTGVVVSPFSITGAPAAMQALASNAVTDCPFTFWTDKATNATMTVAAPAAIWNLLSGSEGSLLDCFGGEYEFDRFEVKLWNRRGADRGVSIRYGKNLTSLEQDENVSNTYTGVYPYWLGADGTLVQLTEKIVKAPGTYDHVRIMPLNLSQEFQETPTEEQLRARAERYVADNDIGTPTVSWKIQHVDLEKTEEYKGKAILERVLLGDTATVEFADMGVSASARVVSADYDPIRERYNSITLGSVRASIASTIVQQQQEINKKPSLSMVEHVAKLLTASIMGAKGGAVRLLDTNGDGMPDELYIGDNADPALAVKVWRFNYEGWAASKSGYNGPFEMGATLDAGILASAITAANLVAGTIKSKDGTTFFLDLDNGILKGNFKSEMTAEVFLDPGFEEAQAIKEHLLGTFSIPSADLPKYDFNSDGDVTVTDMLIAQKCALGMQTLKEWDGAVKTKVTVTVDSSNAEKTVWIHGTNMWGRAVEYYMGFAGANIGRVLGDLIVSGALSVGGPLRLEDKLFVGSGILVDEIPEDLEEGRLVLKKVVI